MAWNDKFNSVSNWNASNLFLCNPYWLNRTIGYLSMQFPIVCDFTKFCVFLSPFQTIRINSIYFSVFFSLSISFILVWNIFGLVFFFQLLFQYFFDRIESSFMDTARFIQNENLIVHFEIGRLFNFCLFLWNVWSDFCLIL